MARRSFIFCDICNPSAIRAVEHRRNPRRDPRNGRRVIDGRMWFEGTDEEAREAGWEIGNPDGHTCPNCLKRHPKPAE
jgi:hypothetical protein